ncbi:putative armadillo-like helical protein [Plasmopara halstedii]
MAAIYRVGERVDGLYDENRDNMWYPGLVRCIHQSESGDTVTFEVLYDDGEAELNVRPEFLRLHVPGTICVGTRVLCHYDGGSELYPGQVSDVQENGRYGIAYDDGEVEHDVPIEHIEEINEETENKKIDEATENGNIEASEAVKDLDDPKQVEESQQNGEGSEIEETENHALDGFNGADTLQENTERDPETPALNISLNFEQKLQNDVQSHDNFAEPTKIFAQHALIHDSLELLEKRLGDPASTKSVLSTLVKQMRASPQDTAEGVNTRNGERLVLDALRIHQSHAVIQCYGFVLLRRLCFLSTQSAQFFVQHGIVELIIQAMNVFPDDAILQASACGALAVFTTIQTGLNSLIEHQVADLVLTTLIYHKTYSVHTRQVHYYGCEGEMLRCYVLLELCELDDRQTFNMLCGDQDGSIGDMPPISLLLFLLRQGLSLDDKKTCCAVGSLLMCLAASGEHAAVTIMNLNGVAELSSVMARYPSEASIQKYASAASKQMAQCNSLSLPTTKIKEVAHDISRETKSTMNKNYMKSSAHQRFTGTGKRKGNWISDYEAPMSSRGSKIAQNSSAMHRHPREWNHDYAHAEAGFGGEIRYPKQAASAPQPSSRLVLLEGTNGRDSNYKYRQLSKEARRNELYEAYGMPNRGAKRPHRPKRSQQKIHHVTAEQTWATDSSNFKSRTRRLNYSDRDCSNDVMSNGQNDLKHQESESLNSADRLESHQAQVANRKKKSPNARTAFHVKVENDNQLRVLKDTTYHSPPHCLGTATKRAAKARRNRLSGGRPNDRPSESLNEYARHLFQESASQGGINMSRLTPREKEEIRERERLSFADKLHKMIDRAKLTLANGNTASVPVQQHAMKRLQKSNASGRATRKAQQVSSKLSENSCSQSQQTCTPVSRTSKQPTYSSHRESLETRPAKPTLQMSKRIKPSNVAASSLEISRQKASSIKNLPDSKSRAGIEAVKATTSADIEDLTDSNVNADTVISCDSPAVVEVSQVKREDANAVDSSVPTPTVQVEPEASIRDENIKIEVDSVTFNDTVHDIINDEITKSSEENVGANTFLVSASVKSVDVNVAVPVLVEETAVDNSFNLPQDDAQQPREAFVEEVDVDAELRNEQIDAMYDDAFVDYDDNGDDEDMIDTQVDELISSVTNIIADPPMQESKSGGALYDDENDNFDDDVDQVEGSAAKDEANAAIEFNVFGQDQVDILENKRLSVEEDVAVFSKDGDEGSSLLGIDTNETIDNAADSCLVKKEEEDESVVDKNFDEEEQDTVDKYTDEEETEQYDEESENAMDALDTATKADTCLDHAVGSLNENGDIHNHETVLGVETVGSEVRTQMDDAVEYDEPVDQFHVLQENSEAVGPLDEPDNPEEANVSSFQQVQDDLTDESELQAEADEESKELPVDSSIRNDLSAVYDEDNFDDEDGINESEPDESDEIQSFEIKTKETIELLENKEKEATIVNALVDSGLDSYESHTFVAQKSELVVESAAYDEGQIDDGENYAENMSTELKPIATEMAEAVLSPTTSPNDEVDFILRREVNDDAAYSTPKIDEDYDRYEQDDEAGVELTDESGGDQEKGSKGSTKESLIYDESSGCVEETPLRNWSVDEEGKESYDDADVRIDADVPNLNGSDGVIIAASSKESPTISPADSEMPENDMNLTDTELVDDNVDLLVLQPAAVDDNDFDKGMEEQIVNTLNEAVIMSDDADIATVKVKIESEGFVDNLDGSRLENDTVLISGLEKMDNLDPKTALSNDEEQSAGQDDSIIPAVNHVEQPSDVAADMKPDWEGQSDEQDEEDGTHEPKLELEFTHDKDSVEVDFAAESLNLVEPSTSDSHDEFAYEDAEFDDIETDDTNGRTDAVKELDLISNKAAPGDEELISRSEITQADKAELTTSDVIEQEAFDMQANVDEIESGTSSNLLEANAVGAERQVVDDVVAKTDTINICGSEEKPSDGVQESNDLPDSEAGLEEEEGEAINVIPISSIELEELAPDAINDEVESVEKESAENAHAETSDSKDGKVGSVELDPRPPEPTAFDSEELEDLPGSKALSSDKEPIDPDIEDMPAFHEEVNGLQDSMSENDNRTNIEEQANDAKLEEDPSMVAAYGTADEIVKSMADAANSAKVIDICDVVPDASSDTLMESVQQDEVAQEVVPTRHNSAWTLEQLDKIADFNTAVVEPVGAAETDDAYDDDDGFNDGTEPSILSRVESHAAAHQFTEDEYEDDEYSEVDTPRTDAAAQSILPPIPSRESMLEEKPNVLEAEVYKNEQDEYNDDDHDDRLVKDSIKFTSRADGSGEYEDIHEDDTNDKVQATSIPLPVVQAQNNDVEIGKHDEYSDESYAESDG